MNRAADVLLALLWVAGQVCTAVAMFAIALAGTMGTANCNRPDPCGSQTWLDVGWWFGVGTVIVIPLTSWIFAVIRGSTGRWGSPMILIGLIVMIIAAFIMFQMFLQAGPVSDP
ncbi:hypothetical protein GOEFS_098_00430 [Gordonia effusa NBRC 100432]|uniref:Uncharacterized protein n=1 Tax=Gordonia effusa NBRC 100432 TaxID=1077974 RepID=H0R4H6_9ACTN|nr:hypothetical protein [Gordonia effusa]GAB19977.1 hypothetical protein GOEFS_098_00430 [Gordonia effusa NBRC 100432]